MSDVEKAENRKIQAKMILANVIFHADMVELEHGRWSTKHIEALQLAREARQEVEDSYIELARAVGGRLGQIYDNLIAVKTIRQGLPS